MGRAVAVLVGILALALWIYSGNQNQQGYSGVQSTVSAQITSVVGPTPTATAGR